MKEQERPGEPTRFDDGVTVKRLREFLANLPDDMEIMINGEGAGIYCALGARTAEVTLDPRGRNFIAERPVPKHLKQIRAVVLI